MAERDVINKLGAATTRRTIVRTGAKVAYSAPVVAATYSLSGRHAAAQVSPGGGGPDPICNGHDACQPTPTCGQPGSLCSCSTLVEGGGLCRPTVSDCDPAVRRDCNSDADCLADRPYCVIADNCCTQAGFAGVCTSRCPTP